MTTTRVMLADDHSVVRVGMRTLINNESGMEVIGEASDGASAVSLANELKPDVVVLDISMPGPPNVEVTQQIRERCPNCKILVLTIHEDKSYMRTQLEAGAAGYVLKRAAVQELVHAIRVVAGGGVYLDPALAGSVVDDFVRPQIVRDSPAPELSEREAEVVRLIALGYSNKEIASLLELSVKTIETYKARSMEKLGMRSRVDIVQYAAMRGWLMPGSGGRVAPNRLGADGVSPGAS